MLPQHAVDPLFLPKNVSKNASGYPQKVKPVRSEFCRLYLAALDISARHTNMVSQPSFEHDATYRVLPIMGPSIMTEKLFTESVLEIGSSRSSSSTLSSSKAAPGLYITGLGSQYPPFLFHPDRLEGFISKWYDLETPG